MRSFGHYRPDGNYSPAGARTQKSLGHSFGADHEKRLVVTLEADDLITLRPERTLRPVSIPAAELYRYLLFCKANRAHLERARARKAAKAARLAALRQARAEKRLFQST